MRALASPYPGLLMPRPSPRLGTRERRNFSTHGDLPYRLRMALRRHRAIVSATLAAFLTVLSAAACANAGKSKSGTASPEVAVGGSFSPEERIRIAQAQPYVQEAAKKYGVDADLINALIWVESKFDPKARGPGGAAGLMQLMPSTAKAIARQIGETSRPYNPEFNVRAGSYYIGQMLKKFKSEKLAIAAYQAGAGSVRKWQKAGTKMPSSSEKYVATVLAAKSRLSRAIPD